jgi:VanZ family protein
MMNLKLQKGNCFNKQLYINCYLPLALLVIIYLSFRSKSYLFLKAINLDAASYFIEHVQSYFICYKQYLPSWFIYSLPDGLWTYSMTCLYIQSSYQDTNKYIRTAYIWFIPTLSLSIEIAQKYKIIPGTFDDTDICFIIIASILAHIAMFRYLYLPVSGPSTTAIES